MVNNADAVLNTYEELIAESTYFSASLQNERLSVISIPTACVPKIAWWLMREYGLKEKRSRLFHSLLMDNDGLSLCCNPSHLVVLESLLQKSDFTVSPQLWRPLIINVTGTASEFPGTVYFLASRLSSEGLSIFHISTFESEVFLIQDTDVVKATNILQSINIDDILGESGDRHVFDADQRSPVSSSTKTFPEEVVSEAEDQVNLDLSWIAPKENRKDLEDTFHLVVLPHAVVLAKLNNDFDLSTCSTLLVSSLINDCSFNRSVTNRIHDYYRLACCSTTNGSVICSDWRAEITPRSSSRGLVSSCGECGATTKS